MPLRRLELYNFKSYRGTQKVDLGDAPFTCIIGPNGSGKSNLMDAISFVLGVKSAQLRSTQLKDLIYRGRKAAEGANEILGLDVEVPETQDESISNDGRNAWVMAVYEDGNGKEWRFKRTIAMSGSSTYYLNEKAVSWNDYNRQLEKFNILVKAKNFLVFQGDVEGVASQDSKALAKLIDRISGSLELAPEYEAAKLAQEKASEEANSNHAKKRGMLTEAKHFKEQTAEVKHWEKLRDEKDGLVQRNLLWRLYHITEEINESIAKVEEATEQLHERRNAVDESDAALKEARKDQGKVQLNVKKREAAVKKAQKAVEEKKPDLVAIETQIAHTERKDANSKTLFERVQKDRQRQADSLAQIEKGAAEIEARMEEAREKQRQKSKATGKALSEADLAEYRNLRSDANTKVVTERQKLESLRREQKSLRDSLASAEDKVQQAERKRGKLSSEVESLADREEALSAKVTDLKEERKRIKTEIDKVQAQRTQINIRETEANERLQDILNKLLQAGADKRESEREVRLKETLANLKRIFPGVHGRVFDLCKASAQKYQTAVMTVLGRNLDSVVVEEEKVAIECIEYMRQQRAGQATFIPLDRIQVAPVPEKLRNFAKGARLAIDCIEADAAVEKAIRYACGSTLICDTSAIAKHICYDKRQDVKAVTLEGTVIHKSGQITGGRGQDTRKAKDHDVDALKAQKEKVLQQLKQLNQEKPKEKAEESQLQGLARLQAELSMAEDDLGATQLRLNGLRKELGTVNGDLKKMVPDQEKKASALSKAEKETSKLASVIEKEDDKVFADFCKRIKVPNIREYEDVQLKVAREENEAIEAFSAQSARASHQIEFERSQLNSTDERLAHLQSTVDKAKKTIKQLHKNKASVEAEIEKLQEEIAGQQAKLEETNAELEEVAQQVEAARDHARKQQRALDRALKEIAGWNDEIERSDSNRHAIYRRCRLEDIDLPLLSGSLDNVPLEEAALEQEEDQLEDTLRSARTNDFDIEPDFNVLEDEDKEDNSDEVGRRFEAEIANKKAELERVVPNMKAMERLSEVQKSLEEAEEEADETRQSAKAARDKFQALKKKRCELFNKAFKHMAGCIDRYYKDLTKNSVVPTGGVAFLNLEDVDEPYLGGVKYSTMPPGKRFVEIDQLSGGEKTMAALALLFSIHSYHPAPFFVLDEVDAALDATNVAKLARFVREQAEGKNSDPSDGHKPVQFLIISLKSTLYEHADSLVGVYREQVENSSRTLSLDLSKYE
ncbi:Structural maintenance of chromosomes protein 1 [Vanrija albida]|uniref:Structural maintenance of chromosomes protein n=1 Tax=Vanrija albida TaxID=181172 RepID=A0ABR3PWL3_9TREE